MKKANQALMIIIVLAVILPLSTLWLPVPPNPSGGVQAFRIATISTTLLAWLHFGAAGMFLLAMDVFKAGLKQAYRAICAAILVLGIAQLQFPVLSALNLWSSVWVTRYGMVSVPGLIAGISLFFGVRSFAFALKDKSWLTSRYLVIVALVIGVGIGVLLDVPYTVEAAGGIATATLGSVNAALVLRIKRITGVAYTGAFAWLFLAVAVTTIGTVAPTIFDLFGVSRGPILALPAALAGVLFVKAGYAFNKIREY
jgi:hypothetical protein